MDKIGFRMYELHVFVIYLACLAICYLFRIKKDTWLLSERGTDARDNGYVFYRYLKTHHPEINVKYVISRNSVDKIKIDSEDIINHGSIKHYIYFITSKFLISSHVMGYAPETRLFVRLDMYNLVKVKGKNIFLQHGIIYNKDYVKTQKQQFNLDLFICGAKPEYEYLLKNAYLDDKILKLTGLARYDNYYGEEDGGYILVMPTWRYNISKINTIEEFANTKYVKIWNSLINNKVLNTALSKEGLKLVFYPHYEFQKHIKAFNSNHENVIIADFEHYDVNELLKGCSMLVTDFSSIFFDVHYMRKPVLYYQFDEVDFRKYHHETGWYDFEDGFGRKEIAEDKVVKYLVDKIHDGFRLEKRYSDRIEECFVYNDHDNCERIYNEIVRLETQK